MSWKVPWYKRLISFLIWTPRRFIYRILGLPDEIEESIGGLNWAVQQDHQRIDAIEAFLNIETKDEYSIDLEAEEVTELPDGGLLLSDAKITGIYMRDNFGNLRRYDQDTGIWHIVRDNDLIQ